MSRSNSKLKIVIAPDSFKGSLSAAQACAAIATGVLRAAPKAQIISVPMADGGEGTVQSLIDGLGGELILCNVQDPLGRPIIANYGITQDGMAILEMAQASGLPLLAKHEYNPTLTSTYGTGQIIKDALDRGARDFIMGIGGSATNDGGAGMAQALGFLFRDKGGAVLPRGGGALSSLAQIDCSSVDARIAESRFTIACDVDNPLNGPRGASAVFGPQKGADPGMVAALDKALANLAIRIRYDIGKNIADIPGAGAAGGLGAGAIAFLGATLRRGVDIVINATGLSEKLNGASLLITGEGRTDSQTLNGKTAHGVALLAKSRGVPVIIISGAIANGSEALFDCGVTKMYSLVNDDISIEYAMQNGAALLEQRSFQAICEFAKINFHDDHICP